MASLNNYKNNYNNVWSILLFLLLYTVASPSLSVLGYLHILCVVVWLLLYVLLYCVVIIVWCCFIVYKTIILPAVLYGCETWSLTLRDEGRLRVLENRVLRRIFGPKRDEETGGWRKLHMRSFITCTLLHTVQTGSGAHSQSYQMDAGLEGPGREADHSPPSNAESKNGGATIPLPICLHGKLLY
jgi:hypothetical protein